MTQPLLLALLIGLAVATSAVAASLESTIDAAVKSVESRVVQLRYFGDGGDSLGASAAPVTGYSLGDGWVLTSLYGLGKDPAAIVARYADGSQESLVVGGRDLSRQIVLLKPEPTGTPQPVLPASRAAVVGETAIALGRVYAADDVCLTVGVVSAVGRLGERATQTDAAASPVNYGGPLIALDGSLLGILAPLSPPGQSGVELYDSGVGFAVTPSQIAGRLPILAAGKEIHPGWLGVAFADKDPLRGPAKIAKALPDGPAALAGLGKGDTITALAGKPTPTLWALRAVLSGLDAGATVEAVVAGSEGETRTVNITLTKQPKPPAKDSKVLESVDNDLPTKNPTDRNRSAGLGFIYLIRSSEIGLVSRLSGGGRIHRGLPEQPTQQRSARERCCR